MIILQGTQVDLLGLKKKTKNLNKRKKKKKYNRRNYSHFFGELFDFAPVFNIESFRYDEVTQRIVFHDFVSREKEALDIVNSVIKNNIYILDYHLDIEKRSPGYLLDFITENRPDILYDIAYLVGDGYYFFDRDCCKGAMYKLVYEDAFCALLESDYDVLDYPYILDIMNSYNPSSGISYIYNVLEKHFLQSPLEFHLIDLPLHLGLIWAMHLAPPSSIHNAVIAGHHVGESTLLEHALNSLSKASSCNDSPFIRYAVFMHDIGKVNSYSILRKYNLEKCIKYDNHYERGCYILTSLAELHNLSQELKKALQVVALYHGKAAANIRDTRWEKLKMKHPLAYEALMATVKADLGLSCINM